MAHQVYPNATPLAVATGATATQSFSAVADAGVAPNSGFSAMFVHFVVIGGGMVATVGLSVVTAAGTGATTTLVLDGGLQSVVTAGGAEIASVEYLSTGVANVFRIDFYPSGATNDLPGTTWNLTFTRAGAAGPPTQRYTWVVADSASESQQPWIHAPDAPVDVGTALMKDLLTGQSYDVSATVDNWGTKELTVSTLVMTTQGDYTLKTKTSPIAPGASGVFTFTFKSPPEAGAHPGAFTLAHDDPTPGHDAVVDFTASTGSIEVVLLLDASGSMSWRPNGTTATNPDQSRWYQLAQASGNFLHTLSHFASTQGQFAVVLFPKVTGSPLGVLVPRTKIPANPSSAIAAINGVTPSGGTPMGEGVDQAAGSPGVPNSYGLFSGAEVDVAHNHRWLVLMSDGYHNQGNAPSEQASYYVDEKKVRAITVAYGDEGEVDHGRLQRIAQAGQGAAAAPVFLDAGPNDLGTGLIGQFNVAIKEGLALGSIIDPEGELTNAKPQSVHPFEVTAHDRKVSVTVHWLRPDKRVEVELISPLGEVITVQAQPDGVRRVRSELYISYFLDEDGLLNAKDPAKPRHGTWRIVVRRGMSDDKVPFRYAYQVLTDSGLGFALTTTPGAHVTGDSIDVRGRLAIDGLPIDDAAVVVVLESPVDSILNWIARNHVPADLMKKAASEIRERREKDFTAMFVKLWALREMGLVFNDATVKQKVPMVYDPTDQVYRATIPDTKIQGTYAAYAIARGDDPAGNPYRRERRLEVGVSPVPDRASSPIDFDYSIVDGDMNVNIRFWPQDRFGNVILIDPSFDDRIVVKVWGGKVGQVQMHPDIDGSYVVRIQYPIKSPPHVDIEVLGVSLLHGFQLLVLKDLVFAEQVSKLRLGGEAAPGANRHTDGDAVLGDPTPKPRDVFVSLGAYGELAVAAPAMANPARAVTVFVQPEEVLQSYRVEVLPAAARSPTDLFSAVKAGVLKALRQKWIPLGTSPGVTRTFSLVRVAPNGVSAVRVVDTSGKTRGRDRLPSASPGVSLRGIGFR
ncbi:vWA domain-containing protein [Sorangium atrum]|uniref:VWA domain-containing protein n=1 Tax=Sorangium atrum TaxID=2995308 RepID=A0ABT5BY19_9BACT|nr:vWA domain-containing protein [Sorangium aterium]MDC0679052.1 VWA domain-containing protein [Sorangium aterium]